MRTYSQPPKRGDKRLRSGFVLWKTIGVETRWFERTAWVEEYVEDFDYDDMGSIRTFYYWMPVQWAM
jgi:hypothetical protein